MTSQLWKQIIIRENKLYGCNQANASKRYKHDHLAILALTRMIKQSKKKEQTKYMTRKTFIEKNRNHWKVVTD